MKVTYYLEVISSWCWWAEPAWAQLKQRYADRVTFGWKIALMPSEAYPASQKQCDWFYRRSGTIVQSPCQLNSGWLEPGIRQYPAPNHVAEAARDFGIEDDRVRLALARSAVIEGRQVGRWEESAAIGAAAASLDASTLLARARSPETAARVKQSTDEFFSFQISQRPAFLLENEIGDRAIFSGLVAVAPLAAAIEAMLHDAGAYASYGAHHGVPPEA